MFIETVLGVFVVIFFAMFFLFGEILVKLKGIGAILGVGLIGYYFFNYLSTTDMILVGLGFAVGVGLIILDGKFINDGIVGSIGFVVVLFSVAFAAPDWLYASYSIAGVVAGTLFSLVLLRFVPKRAMWGKLALADQLTGDQGYNSMNESYKELVGKEGTTLTDLRPSGTIDIEGERYSAITKGSWMKQGVDIYVSEVDGTKILVEEKNES
ncbi:NfeD family protein [Halalkalibacillus halophilus]|uniref:NfeD family protein n=1 Tax=Halalkalibacillus halophilus TaxID=392827 RepID=UPI00042A1554|nr:NfeD family protein [Halalkalibacillus halophilus]